jgi:hypothetical protein
MADLGGPQSAMIQPRIDLARPDGSHQARASNPRCARSACSRPSHDYRTRVRPTHVQRRHERLDPRWPGYYLPDCEHRRLAHARPSQPPSAYLIQNRLIQNRLNASRPSSTRQLPRKISTNQIQAPHRKITVTHHTDALPHAARCTTSNNMVRSAMPYARKQR